MGIVSMQCGVLRAHLLLNLPSQSRMVRQGSLGLRAELDSGDDVLRHLGPAIRAEPLRNDERVGLLAIPLMVILPAGHSPRAFACPAVLHPIWSKGDTERREFCAFGAA
jgi:hypothetical protein